MLDRKLKDFEKPGSTDLCQHVGVSLEDVVGEAVSGLQLMGP